jgi:hypothetical protein
MIEDARHLDNLTDRKHVRMFTGRVQVEDEPVGGVWRHSGPGGLNEQSRTAAPKEEPPRGLPGHDRAALAVGDVSQLRVRAALLAAR